MLVLSCSKISQRIEKVRRLGLCGKGSFFNGFFMFNAVSDLHLASLKLLFDKHAHNATSIVDSNGVTCFVGEESGRRVYQVKGGKGNTVYTVFPDHYCSCHSFFYDIVSKSEGIYVRDWVFLVMGVVVAL